jgi:hypothetical protein
MSVRSAASGASTDGTYAVRMPRSRARATIGRMPWAWRTLPSSDSSPRNTQSAMSATTWPAATMIPTAIGRSYVGPSLRRSAGARLTMMRPFGKRNAEFLIADSTRSFASFTAASGSPTIARPFKPRRETSTSHSTISPSRPTTAHESTFASAIAWGISHIEQACGKRLEGNLLDIRLTTAVPGCCLRPMIAAPQVLWENPREAHRISRFRSWTRRNGLWITIDRVKPLHERTTRR